jgi:xanthine dehydrogenase YagS FAD-binding subunit
MQTFTITQVADSASAIKAMGAGDGARFIAGGTNLVDLMKMYVEQPDRLIDINPIDLHKIEALPHGGIRIGALVRNSDLAYDARIKEKYPVLSQALLSGASPQLRNMATTGGNMMQRTRCPYFFDIHMACNKRQPGTGCAAIKGYNRSHAVLGGSDSCIATHPSDMCVAMAALDATIHLQGPEGERTLPFTEFHLLPGLTPENETSLRPNELITHLDLPPLPSGTRSHYLKVRDRSSYEFALASAAVVLQMRGGNISSGRIALGGVGTKPWRATRAEQLLKGRPSENLYQAVAAAALEEARPQTYNAFKIELARRTLIRALTTTGGIT